MHDRKSGGGQRLCPGTRGNPQQCSAATSQNLEVIPGQTDAISSHHATGLWKASRAQGSRNNVGLSRERRSAARLPLRARGQGKAAAEGVRAAAVHATQQWVGVLLPLPVLNSKHVVIDLHLSSLQKAPVPMQPFGGLQRFVDFGGNCRRFCNFPFPCRARKVLKSWHSYIIYNTYVYNII